MSLYKQFKTDGDIEKKGIILSYGENERGEEIWFRIARAGGANRAYERAVEAKTRPYRRQIQNESADPVVLERVLREVYAETIILAWGGVDTPDGEPLAFSRENAVKLLHDLPDLFRDIREQASKIALFREELLEADSEN